MSLHVRPATPDTWPDVVTVFGTRGDPAGCWCQWWHLRSREWTCSREEKRARLESQVTSGEVPPGLLAYDGDRPVGWVQLGPKESFDRLTAGTLARAPADDPDPPGLWAVTCFVVPVGERRRGVATALLDGAVEFASSQGARAVEGYPLDPTVRKLSSAELFHGTVSMFLAAGFSEVRRPSPARAVVRRTVTARRRRGSR